MAGNGKRGKLCNYFVKGRKKGFLCEDCAWAFNGDEWLKHSYTSRA